MKEKLKAYRLRQIRIQALEEKLERTIALAEKCTMTLGTKSTDNTSNHDKLGDQIINIIDIQQEIKELMQEEIEELRICMEVLKTLPENQRTVMELYYLHGMKWAEVAKTVGYAEEYCWQLQHYALKQMKHLR